MADRALVTFRFTLPAALRPLVVLTMPRGAVVHAGADGLVTVASLDRSETYARNQVLEVAATLLSALDRGQGAVTFPAVLMPSNGEPPIHYAVSLGAKVSIARTREKPHLFPAQPELALEGGRGPG
jgi:hypothetical protein